MSTSEPGGQAVRQWQPPVRSRVQLVRAAPVAILVVLLAQILVSAQDVTEPSLKAAYIYNFAKFTEWPADVVRASEPLIMCVLGDPAVGNALEGAVAGRVLGTHSMQVALLPATKPQRVCHLLYLSGVTAEQAGPLIAGVRDSSVLTISDVVGFTKLGGIARFFFEDGRLRFSVRVESAKRVRLQISARLLALAKQE